MSEPNREIIIGCSYDFPATFTEDGAAYSMTSKVGILRLISDDKATTIERLTSDSSQFTWTSQAGGTGTWHWESNETPTVGDYVAEVYIYDTATPVNRRLTNKDDDQTEYKIKNPETGSF